MHGFGFKLTSNSRGTYIHTLIETCMHTPHAPRAECTRVHIHIHVRAHTHV